MARPKKIPKPKLPPGRPRLNYSFEEARYLVRQEQLTSAKMYERWWKINTPSRIPKRPDRAYKKEWDGWGDFLGFYQEFPYKKKRFRSYADSKAYAQSLGFTNKTQWLQFVTKGTKPEDVPSRPDVYYNKTGEWFTWREFLGYDLSERLKTKKERPVILVIARDAKYPSNIVVVFLSEEGETGISYRLEKTGLSLYQAFIIDDAHDTKQYAQMMNTHLSEFWDGENTYSSSNLFAFVSDMSMRYKAASIK